MNLSIKIKIYLSFLLLVSLFVLNGIFAFINLQKIRQLSHHITYSIDPSLQKLDTFNIMILESKMYSTNWVFLRSNQTDKDALLKIHNGDYHSLRASLATLSSGWKDKRMRDSLYEAFKNFEHLLQVEKRIMGSLQQFTDYDDPVLRLEAEKIVEDSIIPYATVLTASLDNLINQGQSIRQNEQARLNRYSQNLRMVIVILALVIFCVGFLLAIYMARIIIKPIHQIRRIINGLGKGIIGKIDRKPSNDEMGMMIRSVNHLSEKLQKTAAFAREVGIRNFDMPFEPLSDEDTLGKALISMRDKLRNADDRTNEEQRVARLGSWEIDIENNEIYWSDEMFNLLEVDKATFKPSFDAYADMIHPDDRECVLNIMKKCSIDYQPFTFEQRVITPNNNVLVFFSQGGAVVNSKGELVKMRGVVQDITARKKAEQELLLKNKELEQKNKEMEQFAYVASHDLQEPLRTTASFVDLFHRQYSGKIDDKADKYLTYIMQSTERMKVLIQDLLDYSRIGRKQEITKVDCNHIMDEIKADLGTVIQESNATITTGKLPIVQGYRTEIKQLFQNLVVNAIKFRKKNVAPVIEIDAEEKSPYWEFYVKDNGIGIDKQHSERIFVIFQRLHTRAEYEGSGIGLAHCKKIAELHGGKIWIDATPGEGSTFYFTTYKNLNQ